MKVLINGIRYDIKEVEPLDSNLLIGERRCAGATHFHHQMIYLSNTAKQDSKYTTLCHELAHAFLQETQIEAKEDYTEENLCEFVGIYAKKICDIADKYFREGKK